MNKTICKCCIVESLRRISFIHWSQVKKKNGPFGSAKSHMKGFYSTMKNFLGNNRINYSLVIHRCHPTARRVLRERGTTSSVDLMGQALSSNDRTQQNIVLNCRGKDLSMSCKVLATHSHTAFNCSAWKKHSCSFLKVIWWESRSGLHTVNRI